MTNSTNKIRTFFDYSIKVKDSLLIDRTSCLFATTQSRLCIFRLKEACGDSLALSDAIAILLHKFLLHKASGDSLALSDAIATLLCKFLLHKASGDSLALSDAIAT